MIVKFPQVQKFRIALSGGIDSMVLSNFCLCGRKDFGVIHFNHGTPNASRYEDFVSNYCDILDLNIVVHKFDGEPSEYNWSIWRNKIMSECEVPVYTAHHANDSLESFFMRGSGVSWQNGNIFRPLISVKKKEIIDYANRNGIMWVQDATNYDNSIRRNRIRNVLIPEMIQCGIDPFKFLGL